MPKPQDIKRGVVFAILAGIIILSFLILRPIIISILVGLLLAYVFSPVYKKLLPIIRNKNLTTFILIAIILLLIAAPIVYVVPDLVRQIFGTYETIQRFNLTEFVSKFLEGDLAEPLARNLDNLIGSVFTTMLNQLSTFLVNLPSILMQVAVFLFTFFFALRDSDKLKKYLSSLSPFPRATEDKIYKEFRGITNAIVYGQVLIGVIQGLAVGAGVYFLGINNALMLTFIAAIFSIIPVLGSWVVWLPVGLIQIATGNTFNGIFLILYGALFVSMIDNLIRPYLLSKQSRLPLPISIIGTIGGFYYFGILGLVLGPLILAYLMIIIEFYQQGKLNQLFKK